MPRPILYFIFLLTFSCARVASAPLPAIPQATRALFDFDNPKDVRALAESVKTIYIFKHGTQRGSGTVFALTPKLLMTAAHVCLKGDHLALKQNGSGPELRGAYLDEKNDLCILQADHNLPPMPLSLDAPEQGQKVYIFGSPLGISNMLTSGYDGGKIALPKFGTRRVCSAPAYGGNSGGPVMNKYGQVVGVLVMGVPTYPQISFYTPLTVILEKAK